MDINILMKNFVFSLVLSFVGLTGNAQFLLEDTEGRSSLIYNNTQAGTVLLNSEDKKIEFNYFNYLRKAQKKDRIFSVYGEGKAKNNATDIFKGNSIVPEGKLGFAYARSFCTKENSISSADTFRIKKQELAEQKYPMSICEDEYNDCKNTNIDSSVCIKNKDECENNVLKNRINYKNISFEEYYNTIRPYKSWWFYTKGEFIGSSFKLFEPEVTSLDKQLNKKNFTGYDFSIGINYYYSVIKEEKSDKDDITLIGGVSIGYKRSDNFSSLDEISISDTRNFFNADSSISRKSEVKSSAYFGDYKFYNEPYMQVDLLFIPHKLNRFGVLIYGRWDAFDRLSVGSGFYVFKEKSNYNPVGGFNIGIVENRKGETEVKITLLTTLTIFQR